MVKKGDLVKMRLGWSGPGVVQEVLSQHPHSGEAQFEMIRKKLQRKHARVFWFDEQGSEILPLEELRAVE